MASSPQPLARAPLSIQVITDPLERGWEEKASGPRLTFE
jgi:hypothetical protein